jgi:hypothetical protein
MPRLYRDGRALWFSCWHGRARGPSSSSFIGAAASLKSVGASHRCRRDDPASSLCNSFCWHWLFSLGECHGFLPNAQLAVCGPLRPWARRHIKRATRQNQKILQAVGHTSDRMEFDIVCQTITTDATDVCDRRFLGAAASSGRHSQVFHVMFLVCSICKPLTRFRVPTVPLFLVAVLYEQRLEPPFVHRSRTKEAEHWEQALSAGALGLRDWEQTGNRPGTYWEPTGHTSFRYRHSNLDPCRSRYRSQPKARRQRAARFLSV